MGNLDVVVVGGGVVGAFCCYYLVRGDFKVTWVTGQNPRNGASYGNAGLIAVGAGFPLPSYESLKSVVRWILDRRSPIRIRPAFIFSHWDWLLTYMRRGRLSMNPEATKLVREMAVESLAILEEIVKSGLIEPEFTKKGTLFVYASQEKLQRHIRDLKEKLGHLSIPYKVLGASECREHEPLLSDRVAGGILFKEDAWVNPSRLLLQMRELLARLGVKIITREATRLEVSSGRVIGVRVDGEYLKAANYVLSIGSHTKQLLSKVGLIIPVAPAWGYTVVLEAASHRIRRPIIIGEKRLAVSQTLDGNIRLSGFFELSPLDYSPPRSRYLWLRENASDLLPIAKDLRTVDEWAGARPCTPDGLPIIGRISTLKNALLAVGHCREGLTLAPATGKMVSEIIRFDAKPDRLLSPDRFGL